MGKRIRVCGECDYCQQPSKQEWPFGARPFACYYPEGKPFVVPQRTNERAASFKRIPLSCPRPDSEVIKSQEPRPPSDWIERVLTDRERDDE